MKNILIKSLIGFITFGLLCLICINTMYYESHIVPGTVIGKNVEQYAHGKHHRNMSTRYVMCVKPNDNIKFKTYDVYVTYSTYCTHNIGDGISFKVCETDCLRDFKPSLWKGEFAAFTLILSGMITFVCFSILIAPLIAKLFGDDIYF